jgi:DinB family protein
LPRRDGSTRRGHGYLHGIRRTARRPVRQTGQSGVVLRGAQIERADIDAPWLFDGYGFLLVKGVDIRPFVEAELDRRFPGRADRRAADPDGLRAAWATLERTWVATLARAAMPADMPAGMAAVAVDGEWSLTQCLRHLVLATDMWLGKAILEIDRPFHPIGQTDAGSADEPSLATATFTTAAPSYDDVLEVRAGRVAVVRAFLATTTSERSRHSPTHAPASAVGFDDLRPGEPEVAPCQYRQDHGGE